MLAEAKCRKRYTLVPRGKALYEDESRFGTKIMQKMGWEKGKGLGRNESGSGDFIKVRYKNDSKGLGFQYQDDQWTQHERCFNGLLNILNGEKANDNSTESETKHLSGNNSEDDITGVSFNLQEESRTKADKVEKLKEKISGISLEEKSKQSKARVHYKKFTRGKDLSQYSEKDLANILGKKVDEEQQQLNPLREEGNQDNEKYNPQFVHSGISISDYFKMKMEAKKNNKEIGTTCMDITVHRQDNTSGEVQHEEVSEKRKKKRKKNKQDDVEIEDEKDEQIVKNKEKKSRKNGIQDLKSGNDEKGNQTTNVEAIEVLEDFREQKNIKNKSKNKKEKKQGKQQLESENSLKINKIEHDNLENEKIMRKSPIISEDIIEVNLAEEPQKKKRRKNKEDKNESHTNDNIEEVETISQEQQNSIGKNKKLAKSCKQTEEVSSDTNQGKTLNVVIKKPHKNKMKNVNDVNIKELELDEIKKLHNSFNIFPISTFCAEKFRNMSLADFTGSILSDIEGYGFNSEIQLDVHVNKKDEQRIMNLWKGILNKYDHLENPKKIYQNYVKKVIEARQTNRKKPKLHIKTWKRKNAFQII